MQKTILKTVFTIILLSPLFALCGQGQSQRLNAQEFYEKLQNSKDALIIDTRPAYKFEENRIKKAILADGQKALITLTKDVDKSTIILVYCQIGDRSKRAIKVLKQEGFLNVYELKGGLVTWMKSDLPLDSIPLVNLKK